MVHVTLLNANSFSRLSPSFVYYLLFAFFAWFSVQHRTPFGRAHGLRLRLSPFAEEKRSQKRGKEEIISASKPEHQSQPAPR